MTVHAPLTMTKEAFLAWIERRQERYEFAGGHVIMMVNVTRNHARVTTNLIVALRTRLSAERYEVAAEAFAVNVGNSVRFPDVLVEPRQSDGKALGAKTPILIVEVLSPGSHYLDFGDKPREYLSLPTVDTYVVLSADEPCAWTWQRMEGQFPPEPEVIEGADKRIVLPALQVEIPLAELYQGVS
jgi:Uma2 family endonuclease